MIELCKINRLKVVRDTPQGLYLEEEHKEDSENCRNETKDMKDISGTEHLKKKKTSSAARFTGSREDVLLPGPEVPEGIRIGDILDVFIYLDSSDRYTATLKTPEICIGVPALLKVSQVTDIGVFLDWGLDKDLLLPFSEVVRPLFFNPLDNKKNITGIQTTKQDHGTRKQLDSTEIAWLQESGRELPIVLYIDKSGRPAATMRVYDRLVAGGKYTKDSAVEATVVQINPRIGIFVAVDNRYFGMININEITDTVNTGDRLFGRISGVRDDGKYMMSLTQKAHLQMDNDAQVIYGKIKTSGGVLPFGDKSDPGIIMKELGMSKKAFKRGVGQLYKEGKVIPGEYEVRLT